MKDDEVVEDVKEEIKESEQESDAAGVENTQSEDSNEGIDTSYLEKIISQVLEQQNKMQEQLQNVANAQSIIIDAGGVVRESEQVSENENLNKANFNNVLSFDDLDLSI